MHTQVLRRVRIRGVLAVASAALLVPAALGAQRPALVETFDAAWSLIFETHFDPTFGGVDWLAVRDELRPRALASTNDAELRSLLEDMVGRLGQSHFVLIPTSLDPPADGSAPEGVEAACGAALDRRLRDVLEGSSDVAGAAGPGIEVRLLGETVVVTRVEPGSPAQSAGIRPGWQLLTVDGLGLGAVGPCLRQRLPPSELEAVAVGLVGSLLSGPEDSTVELELEAPDGAKTLAVERWRQPGSHVVRFGNLPPLESRLSSQWHDIEGKRVGVIRFNLWMAAVAPHFEEAVEEFQEADGIVLDLRGNPGGVAALAQGIAGYFIDAKLSLGTMKTRRDELELRINPRRVLRSGERFQPYDGPLAILVDGLTASTSEIFAAAMQDHGRGRVFGQPTAAAALPAMAHRLPNGDVLLHATADFIRPGGGRIEGHPVEPDVTVAVTREGVLAGRDEPLEAAFAWFKGLLSPEGR